MIALVRGEVALKRLDHVVIDCGGVGYRLAVSGHTLNSVPDVGKAVALNAHMVVRDDAIRLYGFASEEERDLFLLLIGVQSVGPKVALAVLSAGAPQELLTAVALGDTARFQAVPGIGKRTAERIVVDLKERVAALVSDLGAIGSVSASSQPSGSPRTVAREGLIGLGFSLPEAERLLEGIDGQTPEELIGQALKATRR